MCLNGVPFRSGMKSRASRLHPTQDVTHPFVPCCRCSPPISHSVAMPAIKISCRSFPVLMFTSPLSYLALAPKCKSSGAGNWDSPN